jgi:chorismate mutase-like protein
MTPQSTCTSLGLSDRSSSATIDALETLRDQLDGVDGRLLDCLRERIECCVAIARVKQAASVPMMQPGRIGLVQQRAARYAAEHGIDGDFLRRLYDLIITETCRVETLVMAKAGDQ